MCNVSIVIEAHPGVRETRSPRTIQISQKNTAKKQIKKNTQKTQTFPRSQSPSGGGDTIPVPGQQVVSDNQYPPPHPRYVCDGGWGGGGAVLELLGLLYRNP